MTDNGSNEQIRKWEIDAHEKWDTDKLTPHFFSIRYYNRPFVRFLDRFYNLAGKKILDYGCGTGFFADLVSEYGETHACDVSENMLQFARKHTSPSIKYFQDDFFDTKLESNRYDFIFCRGLGPLMKIDYIKENGVYVRNLLNSLTDDGIAYFILIGNLSGQAGDRLTGFQNHRLEVVHDYFEQAGHVAMINVFGYQAVVVAKSKEKAQAVNQKMYSSVKNMLQNLTEWDDAARAKCINWLAVNSADKVQSELPKLCIYEQTQVIEPYDEPLYFVSGDQDRYFEKNYSGASEQKGLRRLIKGLR